MNVEVVDRNSDDFEPFDKVISQADARTPPRVRRKKKQTQLSPIDDGDTNGEISMDLDDSESYERMLPKCMLSGGKAWTHTTVRWRTTAINASLPPLTASVELDQPHGQFAILPIQTTTNCLLLEPHLLVDNLELV